MSRMLSPSSGKPYGLARVCRTWCCARASVYRHRHPEPVRQRPGPAGPMSDAALLERIQGVLSDSPFHEKAIGRFGPGCGSLMFAPLSAACCG
jgi:putative transposase